MKLRDIDWNDPRAVRALVKYLKRMAEQTKKEEVLLEKQRVLSARVLDARVTL